MFDNICALPYNVIMANTTPLVFKNLVGVKLTDEQIRRLDWLVSITAESRSDWIRAAIDQEYGRAQAIRSAPEPNGKDRTP